MEVGIVGAGLAGLTAAYELGKAGHRVMVFEQASKAGGLASTFRAENWDWPLEKFYHHLFETDDVVLGLSKELGIGDQVFFPRPVTAIWRNGTMDPFDSVTSVLRYPYLSFPEKLRVGLVILYLRLSSNWRTLERVTAHEWLTRVTGRHAYEVLFEPLLANKFGQVYKEVNAAWFWARFHKRSQRLGYFVGGYQTLIDALTQHVEAQGGSIRLSCPVQTVKRSSRFEVQLESDVEQFDLVLSTVSPEAMLRLTPDLPGEFLSKLRGLRYTAALTLVLALKQRMTDGLYWVNLPSGAFPFLAFVEHTNYQSTEHYGGEHIVYLGDYPERGAPHMTMSKEQLLEEFLPSLSRFNPAFDPSWVRASWLFREEYAQPVVPVNYSQHVPPIRTPLTGLYYASMNHVYPWDRGSNYAVEMGQMLAKAVLEDVAGAGMRAPLD